MGCGCKNKENQASAGVNQTKIVAQQAINQENSHNIKESIRKTVEKYYRNDNIKRD